MIRAILACFWLSLTLAAKAAAPLVFCAEADPDSFDSALSDTGATHRAAAYPIYNRLLGYAPGSGALVPELAERWESSEGGRVWVFYLRHGVRFQRTAWFSPSREFNADDVLWTVRRQIDPSHPGAGEAAGGFPAAIAGNWAALIRSIDKVDDYTVRFTLSKPYAPFPVLVASWPFSVVSAEYGEKLQREGRMSLMGIQPVGTGPYQLQKYERGTVIRYAANRDYFKGAPTIDKLIFSIIPDPAVRVEKLLTGECNLVESLKPQDVAALRANARVSVLQYQPQITTFLAFNTQRKPFDDVRVRRALSLAVDRRAIVNAVFRGGAEPGWLPYSAKSLWGMPAIDAPSPDLARARQLLTDAGYPAGFATQIWAAQGGGQNNVNPRMTAELIQADWAKIGVRASVVSMDTAELGRRGRNGEHATIISGWRNSLDPDEFYANLLTCDAAASSTSRWCDATFDQAIESARATPDKARRGHFYELAAQRFMDASPWAVLAYPQAAVAFTKGLHGIEPSPAVPFSFEHLHWE